MASRGSVMISSSGDTSPRTTALTVRLTSPSDEIAPITLPFSVWAVTSIARLPTSVASASV